MKIIKNGFGAIVKIIISPKEKDQIINEQHNYNQLSESEKKIFNKKKKAK